MASPFEQALALLTERLQRAQEVLERLPLGHDEDAPDRREGPELWRVLAVAHAAIASLAAWTEGQRFPPQGTPRIALRRSGSGVTLIVDSSLAGDAGRREVEMFALALRRADQALQDAAELCGLIAGLGIQWAAASFAPPVVLRSLRQRAPRILELGRAQAAIWSD